MRVTSSINKNLGPVCSLGLADGSSVAVFSSPDLSLAKSYTSSIFFYYKEDSIYIYNYLTLPGIYFQSSRHKILSFSYIHSHFLNTKNDIFGSNDDSYQYKFTIINEFQHEYFQDYPSRRIVWVVCQDLPENQRLHILRLQVLLILLLLQVLLKLLQEEGGGPQV